jgi:hypothetical protein
MPGVASMVMWGVVALVPFSKERYEQIYLKIEFRNIGLIRRGGGGERMRWMVLGVC